MLPPPSLLPHHADTDRGSNTFIISRHVFRDVWIIRLMPLDSNRRHGRIDIDRSVPTEHFSKILPKNVAEMTRADGFIGIAFSLHWALLTT